MNNKTNRMFFWFVFGVFCSLSLVMIVFGIITIRDVYINRDHAIFGSVVFGIVLILLGGGILSSTIAETIYKLREK
ncbi:MAG TPA: hypothetical protein PK800_05780 [Syntrophorhabdaceae bacterium]|nr:hypothetical protein [Syntrophorhabdaceae bacterium]